MSTCMKTLLLFALLYVAVTTVSSKKSKVVSMQLHEFICRRCWHRMYRPCNYHVGLTKRSVPFTSTENTDQAVQATGHHLVRRQARRPTRARRASRRRYYRIKINCHICRQRCFN